MTAMYRERTYTCPVDLDSLDSLDREHPGRRAIMLRMLQLDGVRRISFVRRGGDNTPIVIEPDEALHIEGSNGRWPKPAEVRYGKDVRIPGVVIYREVESEVASE